MHRGGRFGECTGSEPGPALPCIFKQLNDHKESPAPWQTPSGDEGKVTAEEPVPPQQGPAAEMLGRAEPGAGGHAAVNNTRLYEAPGTGEAVTLPNPHSPGERAGAEEEQLPRYSIYIRIYIF